MTTDFLVLLPPIIVILMATYTKNTRISLLVGICSAALIINNFLLVGSIKTIFDNFLKAIEFDKLTSLQTIWGCERIFILLFLLMLGFIIALLEHSGSAFAYGNYVSNKLKSATRAESSSLILSIFFFIDDYFSCLTVGSVMQPITDQFKIPRVKLAMLVSSVAVPFAILIPLSSWVAYILGQLSQTGISSSAHASTLIQCDPFYLYLKTIPFMFYALIVVFSIWLIVLRRLSFGIVAKHEHIAQTTGTLFGGRQAIARKAKAFDPESKNSTMWDFMLPITLLIVSTIVEILRSGDYFIFGGSNGIIQVLQTTNIPASLFKSSLITIFVATVYFLFRKRIHFKDLRSITEEGINLMWSSLLLLTLIWTFGKILQNDLQIGHFIATHIGYINISFLPFILFLISGLVTTLMCSAWGSMGLLIPIGVPMLISLAQVQAPVALVDIPMIFPVLGAIISGAIIGNQLSPVADVMLMAAASSGSYHMDLVRAQASLTIPSIFSGALAFLCVGFTLPSFGIWTSMGLGLFVGILSNVIILYIMDFVQKKQ